MLIKLRNVLIPVAFLALAPACSDDYSNDSDDCTGECRTSDEGIAQNFIHNLNKYDDSDYSFKLVKNKANDIDGLDERWIVFTENLYETEYYDEWVSGYYDDYTGEWVEGYYVERSRSVLVDQIYTAFNIDAYSWGLDWNTFLDQMIDTDVVSGLNPVGGNLYEDPDTGFLFEETAGNAKDLEKLGSIKESVKRTNIAKKLQANLGLSEERANEVAKLTSHYEKLSNKRAMTDKDANKLFKSVFGITATDVRKAYLATVEGNKVPMQDVMKTAAEFNGLGPEKANTLIKGFLK